MSPIRAADPDADVDVVVRLAEMKDLVARDPSPSMYAQVTALEDRLGLTPKARRALQWEIAQAEERDAKTEATVRHLRAVDASAG